MEFPRFTTPTEKEYLIIKKKEKEFQKNPTKENIEDFKKCLKEFTKKCLIKKEYYERIKYVF